MIPDAFANPSGRTPSTVARYPTPVCSQFLFPKAPGEMSVLCAPLPTKVARCSWDLPDASGQKDAKLLFGPNWTKFVQRCSNHRFNLVSTWLNRDKYVVLPLSSRGWAQVLRSKALKGCKVPKITTTEAGDGLTRQKANPWGIIMVYNGIIAVKYYSWCTLMYYIIN